MSFIVLGTNHKYSPVTLRERISFSKKRLKDALNFLREREIFRGAVILSTCNRVEIYASIEKPEKGIREIEDFISWYHEIDQRRICPYFYRYVDKQAIKHLLSVVCGLDSLILGESQILGQVRCSFLEAENADFIDGFLREIFDSAIFFAKRIQAETKMSEGKVSVGSVTIDFIREKIGTLADKNILIIGVGKVTELVLNCLKKESPNVVFISNRTFERAKELAYRIEAKAVRFDDLKQFLEKADVVISATASPHFIIKKETLEEALNYKLSTINHKLLIIDLALPRDVEPRVKELPGVELFCLEDLETVIKKNKKRKIQEAGRVKGIIERECEGLWEVTKLQREPALLP